MINTAGLTPKREKFAQAVADGLDQSAAYRLAFDAARMKPSSINVAASKLMSDSKVRQRVDELRGELSKKALWTREMSVKALVGAYREGKPSEKVAAIKELNAMHGYNAPERIDVSSSDGSMRPTLIRIVAKR